MTDIDALIAEAKALFLIGIAPRGEETMVGRLLNALTAERAKVAALEAEATRWREVADELAEAAKNMLTEYQPTYHDCTDNGEPLCCLCEAEVALTRYKQESGE